MNMFEKCKAIRNLIVNNAMMGYVYKTYWSSECRIEKIDEIVSVVKGWEKEHGSFEINPCEMTDAELHELGFGKMSGESELRLIPIWLYPFLKEEIDTTCINGLSKIKKKDMDTDHRYGYLAYGIIPKS
jgi:hypothetical protein